MCSEPYRGQVNGSRWVYSLAGVVRVEEEDGWGCLGRQEVGLAYPWYLIIPGEIEKTRDIGKKLNVGIGPVYAGLSLGAMKVWHPKNSTSVFAGSDIC